MSRTFLAGWCFAAVAVLAAAEGCPPAAVAPTTELVMCVQGVEAQEPAGATILQRIADAALACGADVPAVIAALMTTHAGEPAVVAELRAALAAYTANPLAFRARLVLARMPAAGVTTVRVVPVDAGGQ